jgi:hypothetical protein
VTSDAMNTDPDLLGDDLSSVMGIGTLLANDMVPGGLPASSKGLAEPTIHRISGVRYMIIGQRVIMPSP